MTNLQEAKLAREAEICYATLALVTDYDCWHPDHDSVTVDLIIANLMQNAATAQKTIAEAVSRLRQPATLRVQGRARDRHHHAPGARARTDQKRARTDHRQVHEGDSDSNLSNRPRTHEHRCYRIDRLRLPDVVSGKVHRSFPAGTPQSRQSEFSRGLDGQTTRRLCAEHRLHAGAARRAAAPDGHGRRRFRRLPARGWKRRASTRGS